MMTKTEQTVKQAHEMWEDGEIKRAIHLLINYADTHVRNRTTGELLHQKVDEYWESNLIR